MRLSLNNFAILIILYCVSIFPLVQPLLQSILGDGATTITNIALLSFLIIIILANALLRIRTKIMSRSGKR